MTFKPIAAGILLMIAAQTYAYEDSGTVEAGHWELELGIERASAANGDETALELAATLSHGLGKNLDIFISAPYQSNKVADESRQKGLADMSLGLKWRFIEHDNLNLALAASASLPNGDEKKGLGAGRSQYAANLIADYQLSEFTFFANSGYTYANNRAGENKDIWNLALAAEYAFSETFAANLEWSSERNTEAGVHQHPAYLGAGITWSPAEQLDVDLGYQHGLNHAADDHIVSAAVTLHF
ncbi:transporter [Chitinibacter sp. FCG-7]|uniref:Transporter n=1 Tax=Chitinibacter mangrovi TaxID=3153927 RepID=A0AAU7FCP3_9NEIS